MRVNGSSLYKLNVTLDMYQIMTIYIEIRRICILRITIQINQKLSIILNTTNRQNKTKNKKQKQQQQQQQQQQQKMGGNKKPPKNGYICLLS